MLADQRLQDFFLTTLREEKAVVSIFLVNGIKLHGVIDAYDHDVVMLKNAVTQMIFKHAISTVVPLHLVEFKTSENNKNMTN